MSKFYEWSKNGNKMIIHSDFKEFNKQTNCISNGNIIANTMYGNYIRPYSETKCNGQEWEQGHLFNYDLKYFNINENYKEYIKTLGEQGIKAILYEIFIYRNGKKDILGWLIEDSKMGKIIDLSVNYTYKTNYLKRVSALKTVQNILEEKRGF